MEQQKYRRGCSQNVLAIDICLSILYLQTFRLNLVQVQFAVTACSLRTKQTLTATAESVMLCFTELYDL